MRKSSRPSVLPGEPWWLQEAPPDEELPPLDGDAEADVAIAGGGYTGLWTAIALLERSPGCAVVHSSLARKSTSGRA